MTWSYILSINVCPNRMLNMRLDVVSPFRRVNPETCACHVGNIRASRNELRWYDAERGSRIDK
jgi:hypothetical protein